MSFGADGARRIAVPNHNVGVAARLNAALLRIAAKETRTVGTGGADKLLRRENALLDAVGPHNAHAILNAVDTVRDLSKVVLAASLLSSAERAVAFVFIFVFFKKEKKK